MGIRKLKKFVEENIKESILPSTFSPDSKLLIDGNGFLFFILNHYICIDEQTNKDENNILPPVERKYGGDFYEIYKRTKEEMITFLNAKIQPIFYWDGKKRRLKLETDIKRRNDILDSETKLFEYCIDGVKYNENEYPLPILAKYQIQYVLKELQIKQVFCNEEADHILGKISSDSFIHNYYNNNNNHETNNVQNNMIEKNQCVIYGNDSDFYLFKDARYVTFGSFFKESKLKTKIVTSNKNAATANINDNNNNVLSAIVYTRKIITNYLDMSESTFIDFAIYLGNDYTSHFSKNLFSFENEEELVDYLLESNDMHSIANLFSKYDEDNLDASTVNEKLNEAITFSRLLYELKPLDMFPFDDDEDDYGEVPITINDNDNNVHGINYKQTMEEDIYLKCIEKVTQNLNDHNHMRKNNSAPLIEIVLEVITHYNNNEYREDKEEVYESNDMLVMTSEQKRALTYFAQKVAAMESLTSNRNSNNNIEDKQCNAIIHENINSFDGTMEYHNIKFQKMYQKLCKKLLFFLIDNDVPSIGLNPMYWYHGPTFHMLASKRFSTVTNAYEPIIINFQKESTQIDKNRDHTYKSNNNNNDNDDGDDGDNSITNNKSRNTLPIDKHRDRICKHIRNNKITIIHGETGCGKSSRLPQMIINDVGMENVKMFISQPRRIAATSLRTRVSNEIKDNILANTNNYNNNNPLFMKHDLDSIVGLRMGHGVKTIDTKSTRIWFCTAGYLVLVAAHHPEIFRDHTHLIIDEIHERSVDTDLLCYIAKDLLQQFPNLKLILMSATLAADTYREYFNIDANALFVGSRRCVLKEYYLNDLLNKRLNIQLSNAQQKSVSKLIKDFEKKASVTTIINSGITSITQSQCKIAFHLSRVVGVPGRSVLIFVDGINAIYNIVNLFDQLKSRNSNKQYLVIPIHSNIPHEEQMAAFDENNGVVKIVVATNSAESSITLPDCDNVICLGTEKRIEYNVTKHQVCLVPAWISKASATQRAGRTARVRPGTVWRMYTKSLHDLFDPFDPPEILQTPLDHIILRLKAMLNRPVVSILENVITSPNIDQIQPAFDSLYRLSFFTDPSDDGELTTEGTLAATIGLDLSLCKLVIHGIRLGVGREAACIAAALSLDRSPFRTASHFIHTYEEMNNIITTTLMGQIEFDDGHYSIPIMLLRILIWYRKNGDRNLGRYGLVRSRLKTFHNTAKHLEARVMTFTSSNSPLVDPSNDSYVANALRLSLFWVFNNQIVSTKSKIVHDMEYNRTILQLKGPSEVQAEHLVKVLQGHFADTFEIKDIHLRHFTVHHKLKNESNNNNNNSSNHSNENTNNSNRNAKTISNINKRFENMLFQTFSNEVHVRWIRDIENKSGKAYILKSWADSGNPNAERIKYLISKTFLSKGVLTYIQNKNKGKNDEKIPFYVFDTVGNDYISNNSTGKFKYLRSVCPTFIEICIEKMKSKILHHVNVKGCKQIKKSLLNQLFPTAKKISNSSTNKNIRSIMFYNDNDDSSIESIKNSIIKDLPVPVRILMNIQSRTNIRKKVIFVRKQLDDDEDNVGATDDPLTFELVGDVSAAWTFESTEWVKDVLTKQEQKPLVGNLSFISVALNHYASGHGQGNGGTVRGVCASALVIGKSMSTVVVDNITLLPPGEEWFNRAYSCILKNNAPKAPSKEIQLLTTSIFESIQEPTVIAGTLKAKAMKLFPEYNGMWRGNIDDEILAGGSNTVEEELQQGHSVNLDRMKVSAQLLHQRILKLERVGHKSAGLLNIIKEQKEKLKYLRTQIYGERKGGNDIMQTHHNFYNNYNHQQQQKHQEEQQLLPMPEQNMNPIFGVVEVNGTATGEIDDDDDDDEEILLTVHIPSKSLLHQ